MVGSIGPCLGRLAAGATLVLAWTGVCPGQPGDPPVRRYTALERMSPERLAAAHEDALRYQARRRAPQVPHALRGLHDYRAILHVHAEDSAHTGGTRGEVLEDARKAGVQVILLSDHFSSQRDFMDGWRGMREGVLFIPGSEARGLLLAPETSILDHMEGRIEDLIAAARAGSGMLFLSHVEQRVDHSTAGLTGMEIYNRHADAADDDDLSVALLDWLTDPVKVAELRQALERYPDEVLATQLDYPRLNLAKWDRETQTRRLVGVAANDCHHNQVFIVRKVDDEHVLVGTVVDHDDEMRVVSAEQRPGIRELARGREPLAELVRLDFDPYFRSFRNVSTHILAGELTEPAIRAALASGHAYVGHDWMCDPTGFQYYADTEHRGPRVIMGDEADAGTVTRLVARFPVDCVIRLLEDGKVVAEKADSELEYRPAGPGVYRVEGWLNVDGEERAWIYSNPIYLR